jgi:non-ribosomal peptide synthetase component F
MCALTHIGACSKDETILQMAECSFDVHVGDILGTMMIGATLIMLRPRGLMDFEYLTDVLEKKQITCLTSVPSLFYSLFHFVEDCNRQSALEYMKSVGSGGKYFIDKIVCS